LLADVIKEIRNAEEKAEDIRKRAQSDSRKIVQEAERKAADVFQQSVAAAVAEGGRYLLQQSRKLRSWLSRWSRTRLLKR
jgi:vacuolar-type H+-ATPase subunit H